MVNMVTAINNVQYNHAFQSKPTTVGTHKPHLRHVSGSHLFYPLIDTQQQIAAAPFEYLTDRELWERVIQESLLLPSSLNIQRTFSLLTTHINLCNKHNNHFQTKNTFCHTHTHIHTQSETDPNRYWKHGATHTTPNEFDPEWTRTHGRIFSPISFNYVL